MHKVFLKDVKLSTPFTFSNRSIKFKEMPRGITSMYQLTVLLIVRYEAADTIIQLSADVSRPWNLICESRLNYE